MERCGRIKIHNNNVIITNPEEGENYAKIYPAVIGSIAVNGNVIREITSVKAEDKVEYLPKVVSSKRHINIRTNDDKTEAYLVISYEKGKTYKLIDCKERETLEVDVEEVTIDGCMEISPAEIVNLLKENGIKYGLQLNNLSSDMIGEVLVAKGDKAIEQVDDKFELLVELEKKQNEDENLYKIDFRNTNKIVEVALNQEIARIVVGTDGIPGKNVFGQTISAKKKKKINIKIGSGCRVVNNTIYAAIEGKLSITNKKIEVNKFYEVKGDVDIKSGNVQFKGDVIVAGKVTEGMEVISEASVQIQQGVYGGKVLGKCDSNIAGNIISAKVEIGGEVLEKRMLLDSLEFVKNELELIKEECIVLSSKNKTTGIGVGSIIKLLIEQKHKEIIRNTMLIISLNNAGVTENVELVDKLKNKIIGLGPINIKTILEVDDIIRELKQEIDYNILNLMEEAELNIEYCQDSSIHSSGVINIIGKGVYTSEIKAAKEVIFKNPKAVCRGGIVEAKDLIKASVVGSEGSTITTLKVSQKGKILIDVAYSNTILCFGSKKYVFNTPAKDIEGFVAPDGTITINKLQL